MSEADGLPYKDFRMVHERPSCMSCTRLKGMGDLDVDEGGSTDGPTCAFLGGRRPGPRRLWGVIPCPGYDPRPAWDFAMPNTTSKHESGAMLMAPQNQRGAQKQKARQIAILVPPEGGAVLVPPRPNVTGCGGDACGPSAGPRLAAGGSPVDAGRIGNA